MTQYKHFFATLYQDSGYISKTISSKICCTPYPTGPPRDERTSSVRLGQFRLEKQKKVEKLLHHSTFLSPFFKIEQTSKMGVRSVRGQKNKLRGLFNTVRIYQVKKLNPWASNSVLNEIQECFWKKRPFLNCTETTEILIFLKDNLALTVLAITMPMLLVRLQVAQQPVNLSLCLLYFIC